jgi:alpha-glucosidase (family GH31 glycosyl hydrolase)
MDKVLDMGFDGWKCDGTDPMVALIRPWPYSSHLKRYISLHEYGHQYYGSFYNHTKSKNSDALIMARPVDSLKGLTYWAYAPKYVMFSGWVGDQDSSADGFYKAMLNIIHSASKGYLSFGFDIGGYRGQNISKAIYLRWVQTGALLPFMENGGNGKHQPWKFDS